MGGFFAPATTIGGTVLAPGIPLAGSPLSGLFLTPSNGMGLSLNSLDYLEVNSLNGFIGYKATSTFGFTQITGSPFASGNFSTNAAVSPNGQFLAVANNIANTVGVFTINPVTGSLTAVAGSPFAGSVKPLNVAFTPDGNFLISANSTSNNISVYSVNSVTGFLTPVAGSPFAVGGNSNSVTVTPDGNYVLATAQGAQKVYVFSISGAGVLTGVVGSPFATGVNPIAVSVTPNGNYALVANNNTSNVSVYSVNKATGFLTPVAGSPFATGFAPGWIAVTPDNNFALITNPTNLQVFSINPISGALTEVAGSPFATGGAPSAVTVSPDGLHVYVTNTANVAVFTLNSATGFLTAVAGSPFLTSGSPFSSVVYPLNNFVFTVCDTATGEVDVFSTVSNIQSPLLNMIFDHTGGGNGSFNINGVMTVFGAPILNQTYADARYAQLTGAIFTGLITPSSLIGIKGTATNDNVQAGSVGEYIESTVLLGAAVALTTAVISNVTSIALTAGDWDVEGVVAFHSSGTTNINDVTSGTNNVSMTLGSVGSYITDYLTIVTAAAPDASYAAPKKRYSLAAPATIYLIAMADFTVSTCTAYGHISARRVR